MATHSLTPLHSPSLPLPSRRCSQLKKRFLRKTNVIEALEQYQQLAKWLEKDGVHG
jgi:hypothetical protein